MMKSMHLRVGQTVSKENVALLMAFLGGLDGVESVRVDRADIGIRFDERRIPDEQLLAMTKSSVEMLGYHLSYA